MIVEIDEHQHKGYSTEENCELIRMHQIYEVTGIPCIFLRYNPNDFRVNSKLQKVNNIKKLETLSTWLKFCFNKHDTVGIIYKFLYYDNYLEEDVSFNILDDISLGTIKKIIMFNMVIG